MANAYSGVASAGEYTGLPDALQEVLSLDIMHAAQPIMRYDEFAVKKSELSAGPGQTVKFVTYGDLTTTAAAATLTEHTALETNKMTTSEKLVTVTEYGNAIGLSEKLLQLSWDNLLSEAALLLGRDYAMVRDMLLRDVVSTGGNDTLYTTSSASALVGVLNDDTFDVETVRVAVENLQTANAPKFNGDYYVCFLHPHQAAYLRRDPDWIAAHQYAGSRNLFNGEVGRWEDVIFIVSTNQQNGVGASTLPSYDSTLNNAGAGGQDLFRANIIGDQAFALAEAVPVELRDNGVTDFGRTHALAWYGIWGQGVLNPSHIVEIISS